MLDKHFLDSFLKINNASGAMTDAEVSSVLKKAGWSESEVDSALVLLRSGAAGGKEETVPFRPDMDFSSSQLSNLLGVDVALDPQALYVPGGISSPRSRNLMTQFFVGLLIVCISLSLAAGVGFASAHFLEIGPFAK